MWNEAVKINGADPDFHCRDLWDAIGAGDFPEWELGVQLFDDAFADKFVFDGKAIDFDTLQLHVGDRTLPLTLMEANLLRYLIRHEGKAVSRKAMLEEVWGVHEDTDTRAIDNFIVRLRKYMEIEPSHPLHLVTVRGVGYRFLAEPKNESAT